MKHGKRTPGTALGRVYTTNCAFHLTTRERVLALLGGKVCVQVRLFVAPGASDIPSEIIKRVDGREWRWPWAWPRGWRA